LVGIGRDHYNKERYRESHKTFNLPHNEEEKSPPHHHEPNQPEI